MACAASDVGGAQDMRTKADERMLQQRSLLQEEGVSQALHTQTLRETLKDQVHLLKEKHAHGIEKQRTGYEETLGHMRRAHEVGLALPCAFFRTLPPCIARARTHSNLCTHYAHMMQTLPYTLTPTRAQDDVLKVRRASQEQWDFLDRQRNAQVATLEEQGKALKHELGELKAQLTSLSSKSLTKEQASKEAIARAEKHAREMSQLRQAHTHEVEVLQERLTAMSVEVERLRLSAAFSPQHRGRVGTVTFAKNAVPLSRVSPSAASTSHCVAVAPRQNRERDGHGGSGNWGWDVVDDAEMVRDVVDDAEPRAHAPRPLSCDTDSSDTCAVPTPAPISRDLTGKDNFSLSAIRQVCFACCIARVFCCVPLVHV